MDTVELVKHFLRAQNLEQVGRTAEAIELYERAVEAGFDSTGPYDRLIALYSEQARHLDVVRVAQGALRHVHTHEAKKEWYATMQRRAQEAAAKVPQASPKRS